MLNKKDVKSFFNIVSRLIEYTDEMVDEMLTATTGKSRWTAYATTNGSDSDAAT